MKRNLEGAHGNIGRAAHQFKVNRIFTLDALGKQLVAQQGNFVRQAVVSVEHAINAVFQDFIPAAKLLCFLRHIVA